MGPRLFKYLIFMSVITWPTRLKLCRIIQHVGAHSRSVPEFAISFTGSAGSAPLQISESIHGLQSLSD